MAINFGVLVPPPLWLQDLFDTGMQDLIDITLAVFDGHTNATLWASIRLRPEKSPLR
jgi:hypothetical protein